VRPNFLRHTSVSDPSVPAAVLRSEAAAPNGFPCAGIKNLTVVRCSQGAPVFIFHYSKHCPGGTAPIGNRQPAQPQRQGRVVFERAVCSPTNSRAPGLTAIAGRPRGFRGYTLQTAAPRLRSPLPGHSCRPLAPVSAVSLNVVIHRFRGCDRSCTPPHSPTLRHQLALAAQPAAISWCCCAVAAPDCQRRSPSLSNDRAAHLRPYHIAMLFASLGANGTPPRT